MRYDYDGYGDLTDVYGCDTAGLFLCVPTATTSMLADNTVRATNRIIVELGTYRRDPLPL